VLKKTVYSTKSTGMQVYRRNGNVHWTSHMMMMYSKCNNAAK